MAISLLLLFKVVFFRTFDLLLSKLTERVRQNAQASLAIIDSQSVRWGNNRSLNDFDGNKKVKGIKRHILVDKNGFLLAIMVTVANVHHSKAVLLLMRTFEIFFVPNQSYPSRWRVQRRNYRTSQKQFWICPASHNEV
ncbi:MAG TPA: transposase [Flavobacterium sp.]|jgi:hypothetical protein